MAIKRRALVRIQQALIAAQEIGDEKLDIVQQVQDLIENKAKQLELDYQNLGTLYNIYSMNLRFSARSLQFCIMLQILAKNKNALSLLANRT